MSSTGADPAPDGAGLRLLKSQCSAAWQLSRPLGDREVSGGMVGGAEEAFRGRGRTGGGVIGAGVERRGKTYRISSTRSSARSSVRLLILSQPEDCCRIE